MRPVVGLEVRTLGRCRGWSFQSFPVPLHSRGAPVVSCDSRETVHPAARLGYRSKAPAVPTGDDTRPVTVDGWEVCGLWSYSQETHQKLLWTLPQSYPTIPGPYPSNDLYFRTLYCKKRGSAQTGPYSGLTKHPRFQFQSRATKLEGSSRRTSSSLFCGPSPPPRPWLLPETPLAHPPRHSSHPWSLPLPHRPSKSDEKVFPVSSPSDHRTKRPDLPHRPRSLRRSQDPRTGNDESRNEPSDRTENGSGETKGREGTYHRRPPSPPRRTRVHTLSALAGQKERVLVCQVHLS